MKTNRSDKHHAQEQRLLAAQKLYWNELHLELERLRDENQRLKGKIKDEMTLIHDHRLDYLKRTLEHVTRDGLTAESLRSLLIAGFALVPLGMGHPAWEEIYEVARQSGIPGDYKALLQ